MRQHERGRLIIFACAALMAPLLAVASDPPDSEVNPVSGHIETVDSTWGSSRYDVMHITDPGQGQPLQTINISQNALDDLGPRIVIGSNGDSWVVWWRASTTDAVFYRRHDLGLGSWNSETQVSEPGESSRNPEIVRDGTSTWLAYEFDSGTDTAVAVTGIQDDVEPFGTRTILATTNFAGDVDVLVHAEQGQAWVTWVDSSTAVGWREYDYATATWSVPGSESYASDTVDDARSRIRAVILGL